MIADRVRRLALGAINFYQYCVSLIVRPVVGLKLVTPYHPVPALGIKIADHRQAAVEQRWQHIQSQLPAEPGSVLDIGCNLGYYTIESAKRGHFAVGVDIQEYALLLGIIRNRLKLNNVVPVDLKLSPENVSSLPSFDVIIMLQVFHHLCFIYGAEDATAMLKSIWDRCKGRLIFEVEPVSERRSDYARKMPAMPQGTEQWLRDTLVSQNEGDVVIKVIFDDVLRRRAVYCVERR